MVAASRIFDATCLVIGSMAPDFEYFARGRLGGTVGHSLLGLVVWSLPVTLIVAALYHGLVKWPSLVIAPAWIGSRAAATIGAPWRERWTFGAIASCAISAVLGAATHLVWDSFTHKTGWTVRHVAVLRTEVPFPILGTDTLARALQHASSIVGLAILGVLGVRWLRRQPPVALPAIGPAQTRARWVFAIAILGGAAMLVLRVLRSHRGYEAGDLVVAPISGVLAGSIVASLLGYHDAMRFARELRG